MRDQGDLILLSSHCLDFFSRWFFWKKVWVQECQHRCWVYQMKDDVKASPTSRPCKVRPAKLISWSHNETQGDLRSSLKPPSAWSFFCLEMLTDNREPSRPWSPTSLLLTQTSSPPAALKMDHLSANEFRWWQTERALRLWAGVHAETLFLAAGPPWCLSSGLFTCQMSLKRKVFVESTEYESDLKDLIRHTMCASGWRRERFTDILANHLENQHLEKKQTESQLLKKLKKTLQDYIENILVCEVEIIFFEWYILIYIYMFFPTKSKDLFFGANFPLSV